ncbi:bifunctional adenosylcobinamide kinase/adenosylcobinamide-phosphate guanylyltransferase [Microvirga sp. M2]|uniref:bifunctional adenosylcobinamide kinase/adenosylcobinamide-phosphate guanylyltransferase n=1 Tax=Microvirga sp. M2 TaxID=3073270 RepID=UPI0039C30EEB
MTPHRSVLVLGGARSGKSQLAQQWAEAASTARVLVATAQAFDDEMRERIAHHRSERDSSWQVEEAPLDLVSAIRATAAPDRVVLVDCLTLWLSNIMLDGRNAGHEIDALVDELKALKGPLLLVSNEVGQGIVPATALGRAFRDEQGRLNQRVAAACDAAILVAAGCPVLLKPAPPLNLRLA